MSTVYESVVRTIIKILCLKYAVLYVLYVYNYKESCFVRCINFVYSVFAILCSCVNANNSSDGYFTQNKFCF